MPSIVDFFHVIGSFCLSFLLIGQYLYNLASDWLFQLLALLGSGLLPLEPSHQSYGVWTMDLTTAPSTNDLHISFQALMDINSDL